MKENIYKYIYKVAMGTLMFSFVLMLFVIGKVPFGLSASWSTSGLGSSLVFTHTDAVAEIGQKVAGAGEAQGSVGVYIVEEILRREGTTFYRVSGSENNEIITMPANSLGTTILFSVPFMGAFIRMLHHVVGVMTLIGLPIVMLIINYTLQGIQKIIPVVSILERSVQKENDSTKQVKQRENKEQVVSVAGDEKSEYVTVLKPYNLRSNYSH